MLNLLSDEVRRDPFPLYDQIRSTSPVLHVPEIDTWMIFDYAGVKQALADHQAFSNNLAVASRGNPDWLIFYDPPRHTRLRNIIARAFTPGAIAGLEPRIRALSRELLDAQVERGEMDLAGDYAVPLPMRVISELTGIPPADWQRFKRWSDAILKLSYDLTGGDAANGAPLARLEARIALTALLARLPNLELASHEPWQPRKALHVYGPSRLPIRFGSA